MALIQVTYYDKGMGRVVHGWTYVPNVNQNTIKQKAASMSKDLGTNVSLSGSNGADNFNASANNGTVNSSGFSPVHNSNSSSNRNPSNQNSSSTHKPMEMVNTVTGQRIKLPSVGKPPKNAPGLNFSGTSTAPRQQSLGSSIGFINFNNPNANSSNEGLATNKKGVEYVVKLNKNNQITSVWNDNEWQSYAAPVSASSNSNTHISSKNSPITKSQQNSAQSNLNSAVMNAIATQSVLNNTIAGLNPVSSYLMENSAQKQLNTAINKANKQKTGVLPQEAKFVNSLNLSLANNINSNVHKIDQINNQIQVNQEAQQILQNAEVKWKQQHPILTSLMNEYSHFKNTMLNLNAWKSAFKGVGQKINKMASTSPVNLPAGLPIAYQPSPMINLEANAAIALGKGIVQGAKDFAHSIEGIGTTLKNNYNYQYQQDKDKIGAGIRAAINTASEVAVGSLDYFATLPYNLVKSPSRVTGQFIVGGAVSKGLHLMSENLGLTANDVLAKAGNKLSKADLSLKGYPRMTENWNSAITHTDTLGRTIIDNLKTVKGKIKISNEPRVYSAPLNSARLSNIDVVAKDGSVIRPFATLYSKTGKNLNAYRGAVRTALSDVKITHVAKPTNIMDYTLSDASTFLKGTLEKTQDAIRGSEYGQVKVNTIFGPKIVNVARRFVSKTKNDDVHTLSRLTLSLGKKSKTIQNYVVAPNEQSALVFQKSTPTINYQPSPSSAVQIKSARKIVATPSSAVSSTSTVELKSVVSPQILKKYDYNYGYMLKQHNTPAKLLLSDEAKQEIPSHSVSFADNGNAVEFNIKPTVKQMKSIVQTYKVVGRIKGITSDVKKAVNVKPTTTTVKMSSTNGMFVPKYLFMSTNPLMALTMLKPQEEAIQTNIVRTINSKIKSAPTPNAIPSFDNAIQTAHVTAIPQSSTFIPPVNVENVNSNSSVSTSQITPSKTFTNTYNIALKPSLINNKFKPKSSVQSNIKSNINVNSLSLKKNTIQQPIQQTALQKKNTIVNIPTVINIPATIRRTSTIQGTTQKNIHVERPAQIVSNVLSNITNTLTKQMNIMKPKKVQKTIPAQILMPEWAKPLTTNIKYNPFKPTFVSFPMLPFAKYFGLNFHKNPKQKVVKTAPKPQKTIRKFSPFADALSITKMDFKLNQNNKNAVSYKFAIQPKQWQMQQWKPYFKATSPVLPTYRMLLNHNSKKSKSSVKHKKVRLW